MAERVILEDKLKLFQDVGAGFSVFIAAVTMQMVNEDGDTVVETAH